MEVKEISDLPSDASLRSGDCSLNDKLAVTRFFLLPKVLPRDLFHTFFTYTAVHYNYVVTKFLIQVGTGQKAQ